MDRTDKLAVNLDALRTSATSVQAGADDVSISHSTADRTVSSAVSGWAGASATALTAFATRMRTNSETMVSRIGDHSQHMHGAADHYTCNEQRRATEMADVDRAAQEAARNA